LIWSTHASGFPKFAMVDLRRDSPAGFKAFNAAFAGGMVTLRVEVDLLGDGSAGTVRLLMQARDGRRQTLWIG
jgi:hypothetical protein